MEYKYQDEIEQLRDRLMAVTKELEDNKQQL